MPIIPGDRHVPILPGDRHVPKGNRLYDGTWRERMERRINPIICRLLGHVPKQKMHALICDRCRTVLKQY